MRATLLGHACWLFEADGCTLLTDPVFVDPFEEGAVVSCPKRSVDPSRLPPIDAIFISHRHLDHLDFPTLSSIVPKPPVLCPDDPYVVACLRELGFADVRVMRAREPVRIGGTTLAAVPSYAEGLVENAVVIADSTGVILNQVDCPFDGETLTWLRRTFGRPDVHLAMYASQGFGFFEGRRDDTGQTYALNVHTVLALGARAVVPASAGFRFADDVGWWNAHLFPVSRERFLDDLARLAPDALRLAMDPGDVLLLDGPVIGMEEQTSPFCRMEEDDTWRLTHDPHAPIPPLEDDNGGGYPPPLLREIVGGLVEGSFRAYVERVIGEDPVVGEYVLHGATYALEVVFPEGEPTAWTLSFSRDGSFAMARGRPRSTPEVRLAVAASALADLTQGRHGVFWLRTRSRRSSTLVSVDVEDGRVAFEDVRLPDLLQHFVLNARAGRFGEEAALRAHYGLLPPPELLPGGSTPE